MNDHRIIGELLDEIRNLRNEITELEERHENQIENLSYDVERAHSAAYQAQQQAHSQIDEAQYETEQAQSNARHARYERESATRDLERARDWGDTWGQEKALRRLKNLR